MSDYTKDSRYQMFDVDFDDIEIQLVQINRMQHASPEDELITNLLNSKVVVDTETDRKFLMTAEYAINPLSGDKGLSKPGYNRKVLDEGTINSYHYVYEIIDNAAVLVKEDEIFDALGIDASELKGLSLEPISSDGINRDAINAVQNKISNESIYRMMNIESKRLAQEAGMYSNKTVDTRTKLQGHSTLDNKIAEYKDTHLTAIKQLEDEWEHGVRANSACHYGRGLPHFDNTIDGHREKLMQACLYKSSFMVSGGKLLSIRDAAALTKDRFDSIDVGMMMELGDIENSMLIGKPDVATVSRINNELGYDPLDDNLIEAIVVREKGSDIDTNIYVVQTIDREYYIRADQTNATGKVISRNNDSLTDIGIDAAAMTRQPATLIQESDGKARYDMLARLKPNNIRRAISDNQTKQHEPLSPNKVETSEHGDDIYHIKKLSEEQSAEFKDWGGSTHKPIPDDAVIDSVWEITKVDSNTVAILGLVSAKDDVAPYAIKHEHRMIYIDKKDCKQTPADWVAGHRLKDWHISNTKIGILDANGIKTALKTMYVAAANDIKSERAELEYEAERREEDTVQDDSGLTRKQRLATEEEEKEHKRQKEWLAMRLTAKR